MSATPDLLHLLKNLNYWWDFHWKRQGDPIVTQDYKKKKKQNEQYCTVFNHTPSNKYIINSHTPFIFLIKIIRLIIKARLSQESGPRDS